MKSGNQENGHTKGWPVRSPDQREQVIADFRIFWVP